MEPPGGCGRVSGAPSAAAEPHRSAARLSGGHEKKMHNLAWIAPLGSDGWYHPHQMPYLGYVWGARPGTVSRVEGRGWRFDWENRRGND